MKRRLSCLLIALVMLMALLPAVSLVASADEAPAGPAVGTYEYYAQKGMWYGTGDGWTTDSTAVEPGTTELTPLMSFVDLTHIPDTTDWYVQSNGNVAVTDNTFMIWTYNGANWDISNTSKVSANTAYRAYIRITGGQLAGNFYPVSMNGATTGTAPLANIYRDAAGNMAMTLAESATDEATQYRSGLSNYNTQTVLVTAPFAAAKDDNKNDVNDSWALVAATDNYSDLLADFMEGADAKYSIENVSRVKDAGALKLGHYNNQGSNKQLNFFSTPAVSSYYPASVVPSLAFGVPSGNKITEIKFSANCIVPVTDTVALADRVFSATSVLSVAYTAADTAQLSYKMMSEDTGFVSAQESAPIAFTAGQALVTVPKVYSYDSQSLFIRVYNVNLTDAQVKQNHLGDLMYYYDIDLGALTADDFAPFYDAAMLLNVGLHNDGDEATAYAETVAKLNAIVECAGGAHTPALDDGDCTTAIMCTKCGVETTAAKTHTPKADDGDCTTDIMCDNAGCTQVAVEGEAAHAGGAQTDCTVAVPCTRDNCDENLHEAKSHTPDEDDGDCTSDILCTVCNQVAAAGADEHEAEADDGDCTTAVKCKHCDEILIPAETAHAGGAQTDCTVAVPCTRDNCDENLHEAKLHTPDEDDGDCTSDILCTVCNKVATEGADEHEAEADDGDCTTAVKCKHCDEILIPAETAHTGGTATCTAKAKCSVCNKEYGELKAHTPAEDDGDCTTAVKCTVCDAETTAAKDAHTYGEDDLCTVCKMENPDKGLGAGAITGIVCGSVAVAGGAGAAIWWFVFKKKKI